VDASASTSACNSKHLQPNLPLILTRSVSLTSLVFNRSTILVSYDSLHNCSALLVSNSNSLSVSKKKKSPNFQESTDFKFYQRFIKLLTTMIPISVIQFTIKIYFILNVFGGINVDVILWNWSNFKNFLACSKPRIESFFGWREYNFCSFLTKCTKINHYG